MAGLCLRVSHLKHIRLLGTDPPDPGLEDRKEGRESSSYERWEPIHKQRGSLLPASATQRHTQWGVSSMGVKGEEGKVDGRQGFWLFITRSP